MQTQTTQTLSTEEPREPLLRTRGSKWPMHARGVGELLDLAVDLFVACVVPTVGLAFLMWIPVRIVWVSMGSAESESQLSRVVFNLFGSTLVELITVALVIQVVYAELQGQRISVVKPLVVALKRSPALLLSTLIIGTATSAGLFCVFLPGIFFMYIWSVAPAALVLEGQGPLQALGRSMRLVRKSFWRWAGVMVCVQVLKSPYTLSAAMLDQPTTIRWALEDLHVAPLAYSLAQVFVTSLLLAISTAAGAIVITVFYLDCRVRQEGFDLAMRLERVQNADSLGRAQ